MTVAVDPLRRTFLDRVHTEAQRALADAELQVADLHAETEERGRKLVEDARREGAAAARLVGAQDHALAHRRARAIVLAAKRELYEELLSRAGDAVHALRQEPAYAELLERLSALARAQLGADAILELDPPDAGGVRASAGFRHVDYTLDALVGRCVAGLGGELERLWQ